MMNDYSKFEVPVLVTRMIDGRRVRNISDVDLMAFVQLTSEELGAMADETQTIASVMGAGDVGGMFRVAPIDFHIGRVDVLRATELEKMDLILSRINKGAACWLTKKQVDTLNQQKSIEEGI